MKKPRQPPSPEEAPRIIAGRYEILGRLGAGAAAQVYRVRDTVGGGTLALKLLAGSDGRESPALIRAFHHEFQLLTRLRHPHLVQVHDFGVQQPGGEGVAVPWFTMDLVPGHPVDEVLGASPDWACLARVADAVLDALGSLHAQGLVHRDVTPANILVGPEMERDPPPVWLMDLGLAESAASVDAGRIRGTLATVAPETLRGGAVDGRADLYSLGCVLFRLATGEDPFSGNTPFEILRAHLSTRPTPPRHLNPEVPASLEALILELLAKQPEQRPSTADEVRRRLAGLSGRHPQRLPPLAEPLTPALAGREREIELFRTALEDLSRERGAVLLVESEPGMGRSRLLEEFRLLARLSGRPALLIRGAEAPRRPFGLADTMLAHLASGGGGQADTLQARDLDSRAERFSRHLVGRESVLLIDDLHAADAASVTLVEDLARRIPRAGLPCLMVATVAGDGLPLKDVLLEQGLARLLRLRPLDEAATGRLGATMLGESLLPEPWQRALHRASGGVPAAAVDMVTALVRSGKAGPGAPLPEAVPAELAEGRLVSPRSTQRLDAQWEQWPAGSRAVLAALALAEGESLDFDELEAIEPHSATHPDDIDLLVREGLVRRVRRAEGRLGLALAVPALAEAIVARLPAGALESLHLRRAECLAGQEGRQLQQARHLLAAGQTERGARLLVEAAAAALDAGTPRQALGLCDRALAVLGEVEDASLLQRLRRIRASALAALGHPEDAAAEYGRALAIVGAETAELSRTLRAAGTFHGETGKIDTALDQLEQALALSDELGDTAGGAGVLLEMGRLLAAMGRLADAAERLETGLRQARRAGQAHLVAALLLARGDLALREGQLERAQECYREAEQESLGTGSTAGRHAARRGRVLAMEASGRLGDALEALDDLLADARRTGHQGREAEAQALTGRLLGRLGRRSEAVGRLSQAATLYRRLGRSAPAAEVLAEQAERLGELGRLRVALTRAGEARALAQEARSEPAANAAAFALGTLHAFLGDVEAVHEALSRLGRAEAPLFRARRSLLLGRAHLAAGQPDRARELLQECSFLARRVRLSELEVQGLVGLAESYLALRDEERAGLALKKIRAEAEKGGQEEMVACARLLAAELELAQPGGEMSLARDEALAAAEVLARRERSDLAWRAWAAAATACRRLGEVDGAARCERDAIAGLDALLEGLPGPQRTRWRAQPRVRSLLAAAGAENAGYRAAPESQAAPETTRQVQALERLLEINRALNSTLELERLLEILVDTAIELTGAERGFVLLEEGGDTAAELARREGGVDLAGEEREFSRSVARQVIRDDKPLASHDAQTDERLSDSRSIHALQIHSILAHPLRVRGKVVGAIVTDSRKPMALFDQSSQTWLSRLADQAGIALANARLVTQLRTQAEEIRRLNEQLAEQVEEQRVEILEKQSNLEVRYRYDCMIGASNPMQKVYRAIDKILPTEIPVLVTGESGTGKDLVARVLHYNGPRSEQRFVTVNCAALTDTLLESELFGHRRGSFTGADRDRKGLFEQAHQGTLFLDEIGEMPLHLQPKLLRAIQFGEIRRVGEDTDRRVDVRIVAATNRDLSEMVAAGKFREDLFYRLDVAQVHMAPLRERLEDLGLLVGHFLEHAAKKTGQAPKSIEPPALRLFLRYDWPGNVRELENEVTKLAAFTRGEVITELDVLENAAFLERARARQAGRPRDESISTLEATELEQIRQALATAGGNRTRAAEMLGIDRSTLYRKLKRYADRLDP
ncbi:MAG: sigma 54-interacting transcriptional regulator [Acidobacteriota bacterium]|nr:sigma 54-interacting transcriptional regulator [Acidobacteriota bacterium]